MSHGSRRPLRKSALLPAVAAAGIALGALGRDPVAAIAGMAGPDETAAPVPVAMETAAPASAAFEFPREAAAIRRELAADPPAGVTAELVDRLGIAGSPTDVDALLPLSEDPNQRVSAAAIGALGRIGGRRAVERLATMARSNDGNVNSIATHALGLSSDPRAEAVLQDLAGHPDSWRRQAAYEALALRGGERARRAIHKAFATCPPGEAWMVASAVALLGGAADRRLLVSVATSAHDPRAEAAMWALASMTGPGTDDLLLVIARGATGTRRNSALGALAAVRDPRAVELLVEAWDQGQQYRYTVVQALGQSKAEGALDALLALMDRARPDQAPWIVDALAARPEPGAREILLSLAREPGPQGQHALAALSRLGAEGVADLLVARFDEQGQLPPPDALAYLALHGGEQGWSLLEEVLAEGNGNDRNSVVWALQARGDQDAADRLIDLVRDADSWTSSTAMSALEGMGEQARDGLRAVLLEQVRADDASLAAYGPTLARLGGDEARDLLVARMKDGTSSERQAALTALGQMEDPSARAAMKEMLDSDDPALRGAALQTLLWSGDGEVEPGLLERALADPDPLVRSAAVGVLGGRGSPEALDRLVLLVDDPDLSIRTSALSALGATGAPEAEEALIAALHDPELSQTAMWSLQSLGSRSGAAAIRAVASDGDAEQRIAAIGVLANDPSPEAGEILAERLHGDAPGEASSALWALQSRGTTAAATAIAEMIDRLDPQADADLRFQAASSLQAIGGSVARERAEQIEEILSQPGAGAAPSGWEGEFPAGLLDGGASYGFLGGSLPVDLQGIGPFPDLVLDEGDVGYPDGDSPEAWDEEPEPLPQSID